MTDLRPDDETLHAYVDGRLDPARRAQVAAWLQAHPAQAARVAGWKQDADALRAAWAGAEAMPANPALSASALRRRVRQRRRTLSAMAASCVLTLGLGIGLGWQLRDSRLGGERLPMADAVAAYRLFADGEQPLEFDPARRVALQGWLRTHFGDAGAVPDLQAQGFALRGGRLLSTPEGAAAMLVYQDAAGARIGLYLRPGSARLRDGERRDGRLLAQYWSEGGTAFALVGPATQTRMRQIAPLLRGEG
ncbi:anti-sigma factor [Xanthomonas sp. AM6]|uniref:anti-sigma factor family protein n=1 Tax=Xanthomonas sp. AM6 TaxID=2982531 RepID=UPI0021D8302F|nr:anti-sigma factor [Xanthomonas sp. AM6]UYB52127.1 anti-sigma factor [Xanthomonas sp. AM6]